MELVPLTCHHSTPCSFVRELTVRVDALGADRVVFYYRIEGDIDRLQLPAQTRSERADGLWRHTCLEAFIKAPDARAYLEFNFSPSSQWAVYRFEDYRHGMAPMDPSSAPKIICRRREDSLEADIEVYIADLLQTARIGPKDGERTQGDWLLALSAVLEDRQGHLSCWALAHPPGKPDFHHPDSFALALALRAGESG